MGLITLNEYRTMAGDSTHADGVVTSAIEAASDVLYTYIGDRFEQESRTETQYFRELRQTFQVKAFPMTSATVTITGATAKYIDREAGIILFTKPVEGEITVAYTGGLDEAPEAVCQACALLTMHIITGVEEGGKEVSSESLGDYSTTYKNTNGKLPDVVWMLISRYCR